MKIAVIILCALILNFSNFHIVSAAGNDPITPFPWTMFLPAITAPVPPLKYCSFQTSVPIEECQAVVDLYDNTNGSGWTDDRGWKSDSDLCTWKGITCTGGHISEIDLFSNNLIGTIPNSIGSLTELTQLRMTNNQLSGELPESIGMLTSLTLLYLSYNELIGSIPSSIGSLTNLKAINFGYNKFTGSIPISIENLTKLTVLKIYNNQLSGNIPETLYNLINLTNLVLHENQLTGIISESIGNLTNLVELRLGSNNLTKGSSIPNSIGNLTNLGLTFYGGLSLHDLQLCGEIPASITNLVNLEGPMGLFIDNNDLFTNNQNVKAFLDLVAGDWESKQIDICP